MWARSSAEYHAAGRKYALVSASSKEVRVVSWSFLTCSEGFKVAYTYGFSTDYGSHGYTQAGTKVGQTPREYFLFIVSISHNTNSMP